MSVAALKYAAELRRELSVSKYIPYAAHFDRYTVGTLESEYFQVLRLAGAAFESADDEQINNWFERQNAMYRSIASPKIAITQHTVRRRESSYPHGEFPPGFAADLNARYADRVTHENLMVNELYLTIDYRPQPSKVTNKIFRFLVHEEDLEEERAESLEVIEKVTGELVASLSRYEPERLGIYKRNGVFYSEVVEFFAFLVNGEWQRMPLTRSPISKVIATSRPFFGQESIELRTASKTTYGAMLGIKEYPAETQPGFLNDLLVLPFPFVLTQSFSFASKEKAKRALKLARDRMKNADDEAKTQIEEIEEGLDDLVSNRFVMGDHHFSLFVQANNMKELSDNVSVARSTLSETGMVVAREDLALEAAFWAQLPGNFRYRPRVALVNSRNLAGFGPLHNFPVGRRTGNHWGDALTMLVTAAGTPYYFSFHAVDPTDPGGGTKKDVGHTLVIGPTGSGKTVFIAFLLCMLLKFAVTCIIFSKDRDTEIVIRALGGKCYPIKIGKPTGWNPFCLEATSGNIQFLNDLVRKLVWRQDTPLSVTDENDIAAAIRAVMEFEPQARRLGRVLDYLDTTRPDGVYARLQQWCYARKAGDPDGPHAWIFDNSEDTLINAFGGTLITGFDVTEFLDNEVIRTPINMYLFHLTQQLIDGRRLAIFIAEFWKALGDEYFSAFAKDQLKTIRKNNGIVLLDSQSASDALNHPNGRTLIEQTPTKILFPNPDAKYEEYTEGLNLSEREYHLIKEEIPEGARMFLVKQGHNSVVAKLDLKGFDFELDVLSTRKQNIEYVDQLIAEYGEEPEKWLPIFKEKRRVS